MRVIPPDSSGAYRPRNFKDGTTPMQALRIHWLALTLLAASAPAAAGDAAGKGGAILDLRYRFEHVTQDNALDDADAHTLRTRVGYRTGAWHGWSALVEADDVRRLGGRYNDTRNGRTSHSVVADPEGTAINQALLHFAGERVAATVGRQRINLDNQRFVGGVGWRQNEQTYDGVLLQFTPTDKLSATYAWLGRVNTVFGPDDGPRANAVNRADSEGDSHLLNLRYAFSPRMVATGYHYRLDLDDLAVSAGAPLDSLSSATTGVRLAGTFERLDYAAEFARQDALHGNPWDLDSRYHLVELGVRLGKARLAAGEELLGGAGGPGNRAFQTPLGTRHKFQGWADMFVTTPADGVEDRYVGAVVPVAGGSLEAWYHDFSAERGSASYGTELDVSYARGIPGVPGLDALFKYARHDADRTSPTVDTEKFWLQVQYTY